MISAALHGPAPDFLAFWSCLMHSTCILERTEHLTGLRRTLVSSALGICGTIQERLKNPN